MNHPSNRRNFLRGRISAQAAELRPPWALAEEIFTTTCTRCGNCARACPTGIIRQGDGGYPTIDFSRGECTFCGDCVAACTPQALQRQENTAAWTLRARIGEACVARHQVECRICGEQCGEGAIRFPPRLGGIAEPELDTGRCTGCGACVAPCPVQAITVR